jgi:hypothetical protein
MKKVAFIAVAVLGAVCISLAQETPLKGNPDSKVFHKSSCRYYTNTNCTATFSTSAAAAEAGFSACKVCKP